MAGNTKNKETNLKQKLAELVAQQKAAEITEESRKAAQARADKFAAEKAERYNKKGSVQQEKRRVSLWEIAKEKAEGLINADAASFMVWADSMAKIIGVNFAFSKAGRFTIDELSRKFLGGMGEIVFHRVGDKIKIQIAKLNAKDNLPSLEYKVSIEDGNKIKAIVKAGDALDVPELDKADTQAQRPTLTSLFESDLRQWLFEEHGYQFDGTPYKNGAKQLDSDSLQALIDDPDKSFKEWIQIRYEGLGIEPKTEHENNNSLDDSDENDDRPSPGSRR